MCLAIPVQIKEIIDENTAVAEISGLRKNISTALLDDVAVGDYVILHVGYALQKIDPEEAKRLLNSSLRTTLRQLWHEIHYRISRS